MLHLELFHKHCYEERAHTEILEKWEKDGRGNGGGSLNISSSWSVSVMGWIVTFQKYIPNPEPVNMSFSGKSVLEDKLGILRWSHLDYSSPQTQWQVTL